MYWNPIYLFVVSSLMLNYVTGLYFHLAEGERKCFIEEVPSDTMVTSEFENLAEKNQLNMLLINISFIFLAHYKIELYDARSGGFAPPTLGKYSISKADIFCQLNAICFQLSN